MMWEGNGIWDHGASWGAGGWLMGIGMIALIVVAVVLVVFLIRAMTQQQAPMATSGRYQQLDSYGPGHAAGPGSAPATRQAEPASVTETPRDIVQRRYAAGEIDRDEYLQKLADL